MHMASCHLLMPVNMKLCVYTIQTFIQVRRFGETGFAGFQLLLEKLDMNLILVDAKDSHSV